jgi:hypothetical protein
LAALCGAGVACNTGEERQAEITSVEPDHAYNDAEEPLVITGHDLRPAYDFDSITGQATVREDSFSGALTPANKDDTTGGAAVNIGPIKWKKASSLSATVPAGIAAGTYDVQIRDARGNVMTLPGGFVSLGADSRPPHVEIQWPVAETIVGAGTTVRVQLSANDGRGRLDRVTWRLSWPRGGLEGTCSVVQPAHDTICPFDFTAPTPADGPEELRLHVEAVDTAGNTSPAVIPLLLAPRPVLTEVSPDLGPAGGGTHLLITGAHFVPGNAVSLGTMVVIDSVALETTYISATQLAATTQEHDPGSGMLNIETGGAWSNAVAFQFYAAPNLKGISPRSGPAAGGTWLTIVGTHFRTKTQIGFRDSAGNTRLLAPSYFVSATRIEGVTPPGSSVVDIVAVDMEAGASVLLGAFTYEDGP